MLLKHKHVHLHLIQYLNILQGVLIVKTYFHEQMYVICLGFLDNGPESLCISSSNSFIFS